MRDLFDKLRMDVAPPGKCDDLPNNYLPLSNYEGEAGACIKFNGKEDQ
jgi:hypothetical protein